MDRPTSVTENCLVDWQSVTRDIRRGDHQAFAIYYDEYFEMILAEVRRTCGRDESTCLDIVQDTFVRTIRSMKAIDAKPALDAWTRVVARTTTWDWLRRQQRQQRHHRQYSSTRPAPGHSATGDPVEDQARMAWIQEQLEQLPPDLRHMIALRYRLGWSLARIGRHFGLKTGAVDGRIRRTIETLKQKAGDRYDE